MATNFVQEPGKLTMIAPGGGVTSGVPVLIGQTFLIPETTQLVGEQFAGATEGVYTLPKEAALAISAGADVYFDSVAGECDTTPTNHHIGKAAVLAAADDTTVLVAVGIPPGSSAALGDFAALYDANSILAADTDDTPTVRAAAASTFYGRTAASAIKAMTVAEAKVLLSYGQAAVTPAAAATAAALTDNSGGAANTTLETCGVAVTGVDGVGDNAASKADVDTRLTAIKNNFADLAAQVNALIADNASIRTQLNLALVRLRAATGSGMIVD